MEKKKLKIAVDLDGTLAECDDEHNSITDQAVIPAMRKKVKNWLEQGHKVYLFTANADSPLQIAKLRKWLDDNDLKKIKEITNVKQKDTDYYVDDCALRVEENTGEMHNDPISMDIDNMIETMRPRHGRMY